VNIGSGFKLGWLCSVWFSELAKDQYEAGMGYKEKREWRSRWEGRKSWWI